MRNKHSLSIITVILIALTLINFGAAMANEESIIVDMYLGEPILFETMMEDLVEAGIIYLGEIHTIQRHHRMQAEILLELANRGMKPALGMEMFTIDQQPVLDKWSEGESGIDDLIKNLGKEYWTNLMDYELVLLGARKLGIPIVALNAPDKLVKMIAAHGTQYLSDEDKKLLPTNLEINPLNDKLLRLRLRVHKAFQHGMLDNIIAAQHLRDSVMAQSIHAFLNSEKGKGRQMVVIAGSGHINYGFGIPELTAKLNGLSYRIIIPSESGQLVLSEKEKEQAVPIHIKHADLKFIKSPIADYLHVIPLQEQTAIVKAAEPENAGQRY